MVHAILKEACLETGEAVNRHSPMGATPVARNDLSNMGTERAFGIGCCRSAAQRTPCLDMATGSGRRASGLATVLGTASHEAIADGDPYMLFLEGDAGASWKRDPYACELTVEPAFPAASVLCAIRPPILGMIAAGIHRPSTISSSTSSMSAPSGRRTRTSARRAAGRL
jgi:hypothetical protein